jgi:DNA mismatch endonuclease (patch repair protein)
MPDVVSSQKRSQMMAGIRGKDTKPELAMRKALHSKGFRYRLHDARLPGKPDIVLPRYNAVVQINGCFWHGHDCHLFKWPSTRIEFWRHKIIRNRRNDFDNIRLLERAGWRVLIVWECALKGKRKLSLDDLTARASSWLLNGHGHYSIEGANVEDEVDPR